MMKTLTLFALVLLLAVSLLPTTTEARVRGEERPDQLEERRSGSRREDMRHVRRKLLAVCQGACNNDNDCDGDLICFRRNPGATVPACDTPTSPRHNICVPAWMNPGPPLIEVPSIVVVGNGIRPLEECWGNCLSNADCRQGLVCLERRGGDPIPGCRGFDGSRTDYCVRPTATTLPPAVLAPFPNEFRWEYSMLLNLGYPGSTPNRTPTTAEYTGARQAIVDWLNDASRLNYANPGSFRYERTDVTVVNQNRNRFVLTLSAVFKGNTRNEVPLQVSYLQAMTSFNGGDLIKNFRDAAPANSIFNTVQSESRVIVAITPTLPPGATLAPGAFRPPCLSDACTGRSNSRDSNDRRKLIVAGETDEIEGEIEE